MASFKLLLSVPSSPSPHVLRRLGSALSDKFPVPDKWCADGVATAADARRARLRASPSSSRPADERAVATDSARTVPRRQSLLAALSAAPSELGVSGGESRRPLRAARNFVASGSVPNAAFCPKTFSASSTLLFPALLSVTSAISGDSEVVAAPPATVPVAEVWDLVMARTSCSWEVAARLNLSASE
jgi:hypothetical protein